MKGSIIIISLSAAVTIATSIDNILIFLLSGAIPGTYITLPPWAMISIIGCGALCLFYVIFQNDIKQIFLAIKSYIAEKPKPTADLTKKSTQKYAITVHLPQRRYQEL